MINEPYIPDDKDWDYFYELDRNISDAVVKSEGFESHKDKSVSDEHNGLAQVDSKAEFNIFESDKNFY